MKKVCVVLGTRPEVIKLAPIILNLQSDPRVQIFVVFSGQHTTMAKQALETFGLKPDVNLDLMTENQNPNTFLSLLLPRLEGAFTQSSPDVVIVQGDTTSALGGALAAFHKKIPVAHIEAGLRTGDLRSPFPEEMNRRVISVLSKFHFCHSEETKNNLLGENIRENIFVVGNPVVDALLLILKAIEKGRLSIGEAAQEIVKRNNRIILVTGHRRENFDAPLRNLCRVLKNIVASHPQIEVVYPVHLNPNVQSVVLEELQGKDRINLLSPLDYPSFVWMMKQSSIIVSDSGGIQEEAPSLGKYVFVTRTKTERPEAVRAGFTEVISLEEPEKLEVQIQARLKKPFVPHTGTNPYGDGTTAERVVKHLFDLI